MTSAPNLVTLHPYFKAQAGRMAHIQTLLQAFVDKTRSEAGCVFYEFTLNDDVVFCREGYQSAAAVLTHLENVGPLLDEMLTMADLVRLELHGPAEEIDALREPMAQLQTAFFVRQCGL